MSEPLRNSRSQTRTGSMFHVWSHFCGVTPVFDPAWKAGAALALSVVPQGAHVIDLGCGAGGLTKALIRAGFSCTAVEWNAWMLEEAGRRLLAHKAEYSADPVELLLADGYRMPLPGNSFALATNFLGLHGRNHDDQEKLLAEMRRLAPMALLIDWQMPERNLEVPAAWLMRRLHRLAGDRNMSRNLADYHKTGALEGVLYNHRSGLRVRERHACLGGSLGLAVVDWK